MGQFLYMKAAGAHDRLGWDPSMSVGESTIDGQHRNLLGKITELRQIIASMDADVGQLRDALHFLYVYIKEHFAYEESYMAVNEFPGIEKHKAVHQEFVRFYDDLQKEFRQKSVSGHFSSVDVKELLEKTEAYLGNWLVNHIKGMDQEYAKYIAAKK